MNFNKLPSEVQDKVKSVLYLYDKADVTFECGQYHVSAHVALRANYADDFTAVGTYTREMVYTRQEREENRKTFVKETANMDWSWFGA